MKLKSHILIIKWKYIDFDLNQIICIENYLFSPSVISSDIIF
jgi:hypothetical protein